MEFHSCTVGAWGGFGEEKTSLKCFPQEYPQVHYWKKLRKIREKQTKILNLLDVSPHLLAHNSLLQQCWALQSPGQALKQGAVTAGNLVYVPAQANKPFDIFKI